MAFFHVKKTGKVIKIALKIGKINKKAAKITNFGGSGLFLPCFFGKQGRNKPDPPKIVIFGAFLLIFPVSIAILIDFPCFF